MINRQTSNLISLAKTPIIMIGGINDEDIITLFKTSKEDFFKIESPTIKIQEIRGLIHFLNFKPYNSQFKLAIIENADKMTIDATNALLKTLEEPPQFAKIILTTKKYQKILATISSRCIKIRTPIEILSRNESFLSLEKLSKMTIAEKFNLVSKVIETENVEDIFSYWQDYYRKKLLLGIDVSGILKELSFSKDLLERNISLKLLLENITLIF